MLSLNSVAEATRKTLKWGGGIVGGIIALLLLIQLGFFIRNTFFPPPAPPPEASFGKLSEITFPEIYKKSSFNYSVDTLTGLLPNFSDRMKVYKIKKSQPDLLALEVAQEKLRNVGFSEKPSPLGTNTYKWSKEENSIRKDMIYNVFSNNFNLSSPFYLDSSVLTASNLNNPEDAIETSTEFLTKINALTDDMDVAKTTTSFYSLEGQVLRPATSISNAQVVEVNFFQKNIDEFPIYYPKAKKSTMSFIVGGGRSRPDVLEAQFFHQSISDESSSYSIKSVEEAFEDLKKGNAHIASLNGTSTNISINEVFLAYYLGTKEQDYLMPIIVFSGPNDFYAYVSAVKDQWIEE